ncbi:MAG: SpoIIE family protein phosphatase [Planctomycetes bacterium]|nr:SpoIIE family protein phosphatase [Planctomycetota bacterium]MCB9886177.1 SpoIIE family protein phosphatase [Planctomycetota bacterium]
MARKGSSSKSRGKLARNLALGTGIAGLLGGLLLTVALVNNLSGAIDDPAVVSRGWQVGLGLSALLAVLSAGTGWVLGGKIATRITDVGLGVSKLGRGGSEVRVRVAGDDEVAALGRAVQFLATDLAELLRGQDEAGGVAHVSMDPQVRQLRDKVLPHGLGGVPGYEVDGALGAGSRGGLDYFDLVIGGDPAQTVLYVVSAEGHGALAVFACRLARDELHRALGTGATPRKSLAHVNKVLKNNLPAGCCAKASLLQITEGGAKLYQAGARSPLLICQRGEVLELNAEGLALGLDDGPVFEKSLRPQEVAMSPGIRLVLGNDALLRQEGVLDLLRQHSPRHTNMFMNMVLGSLEQDAGDDGLREDVVLLTVKKAGQE